MSSAGALDEVVRRLEANLKTARRLRTPLGAVELGRHVYVRRALGDVVLAATLEARKGIVFRSATQVSVELVDMERSVGAQGVPTNALKAVVARREAKLRNRLDLHAVLGVYSASGWADAAIAYARNDPPGTGYAHASLHLVLVGPAPSDLVTGAHDELARSFRPVLRGRTDDEEAAIAREHLEKALALENYAVLERVARETGLDDTTVERAARALASGEAGLRMETVSGAGPVLRRKG